MKLDRQDVRALQLPLMLFGAVLAISVLMIWYTDARQTETAQALQAQKAMLNQARQRYFSSGAEREAIIKYLPPYRQLIQQGLIGEERRIEWIDNMRAVNQQYKLFGVSYTIGAQENYKPPMQLNPGPFSLHRSAIKIDLPLLHENDLLILLNAMSADHPASLMARDCVIKRLEVAEKYKLIPYLHAGCELDLVTISEPAPTEARP
ncbi:MAG: hypothetical protein D4R48_03930 [Nitrosomonadales bacterium]|nr:MAG: hypothetical protein D4R48_03930 [Nitrosomonadales bacterium]